MSADSGLYEVVEPDPTPEEVFTDFQEALKEQGTAENLFLKNFNELSENENSPIAREILAPLLEVCWQKALQAKSPDELNSVFDELKETAIRHYWKKQPLLQRMVHWAASCRERIGALFGKSDH